MKKLLCLILFIGFSYGAQYAEVVWETNFVATNGLTNFQIDFAPYVTHPWEVAIENTTTTNSLNIFCKINQTNYVSKTIRGGNTVTIAGTENKPLEIQSFYLCNSSGASIRVYITFLGK